MFLNDGSLKAHDIQRRIFLVSIGDPLLFPSRLGRSSATSRDRNIQASTSVSTVFSVTPTSESTGTSELPFSAHGNKHVF